MENSLCQLDNYPKTINIHLTKFYKFLLFSNFTSVLKIYAIGSK